MLDLPLPSGGVHEGSLFSCCHLQLGLLSCGVTIKKELNGNKCFPLRETCDENTRVGSPGKEANLGPTGHLEHRHLTIENPSILLCSSFILWDFVDCRRLRLAPFSLGGD